MLKSLKYLFKICLKNYVDIKQCHRVPRIIYFSINKIGVHPKYNFYKQTEAHCFLLKVFKDPEFLYEKIAFNSCKISHSFGNVMYRAYALF